MKTKIPLKASHFKDAEFLNCHDCAVTRAAKDYFKVEKVKSSPFRIMVDGNEYQIVDRYRAVMFDADKVIAEEKNFSDEIIREIVIIKS